MIIYSEDVATALGVNLENIDMIDSRGVPDFRLTEALIQDVKAPKIQRIEDVKHITAALYSATNRRSSLSVRITNFIAGQSKLGRGIGQVIDFITIFMPYGSRIDKVRTVIKRKLNYRSMPQRIKPFIKQTSTWEGIALAAGAIGIFVSPEAATMIVGGIFSIVAGIKLWRKEAEEA
jgi:hypothetical protein